MRKCIDESVEEDRKSKIHNDCSMDKDITPQLPHTVYEILDAITFVNTIENSKKIISHLMDCHHIISLDVKGRDLGTDRGKISLIAVGTCNGQCLLFDIHCNKQLLVKGNLRKMLQCKEIIKVMHNCGLIRSALEQSFGVIINSIFDTQCAHAVIEGHRCGKNPRCVSRQNLLFISTTYGRGVVTPAAQELKRLYLENPNFWDTRPLPSKVKEFAARGVLALLPEVYNNMNRRLCGPLRQTFRTLSRGKCIEPAEYDALQVQRSSLVDSRCKPKKIRSVIADCTRRSCSLTTQSLKQSKSIEACKRHGSLDLTCPPNSTCKSSCKVPKLKIPLGRCISTSGCTTQRNQKCKRKISTRVSCNSVQGTRYLAGKTCATRRHCASTAKVGSCNCVKSTGHVIKRSCGSKKKKKNCKSKSLSNVCLSSNKTGSVGSCISPKKTNRPKSSTLTNCSSKRTSVKSKAYNDSQSLGLVSSGWKAEMEMESQMNNQNKEVDEREQNVGECNDDEEDADDDDDEDADYDDDDDEEDAGYDDDEEYTDDDDNDQEEVEIEILSPAAKRKR